MTIYIFIVTFGCNSYDDYYAYHENAFSNRINIKIHWEVPIWNTYAIIYTNTGQTGTQTCAKYTNNNNAKSNRYLNKIFK